MVKKSSIKDLIIQHIKIVDIAAEFNISLEEISSHNFDKRCKCPSKNHKNGAEKTPSLYIDSLNNNYYCYGCGASYNSIDFYMICSGLTFSEAIALLKERIKEIPQGGLLVDLHQDSLPVLLEISNLFRTTMQSHPHDLKWLNSLMQKTDHYIDQFDKEEAAKSEQLLASLKKKIKERYE